MSRTSALLFPCSQIPAPSKSKFQSVSSVPQGHCILFGFKRSVTVWKIGLGLLFLSFRDHSLHICCPILGNTCFIQCLSSATILHQNTYFHFLPLNCHNSLTSFFSFYCIDYYFLKNIS